MSYFYVVFLSQHSRHLHMHQELMFAYSIPPLHLHSPGCPALCLCTGRVQLCMRSASSPAL